MVEADTPEAEVPKEIEERKIIGVAALILSEDGKVLVIEETVDKPQFDKEAGDISIPAETIKERETEFEALIRLLEEEVGVREGMVCDPKDDWIGDYQLRKGTGYWGRVYLINFQGSSESHLRFKAKDREVVNHRWINPEDIRQMPRRAGALEILEDFKAGRRGVIREECSPGFRPNLGIT